MKTKYLLGVILNIDIENGEFNLVQDKKKIQVYSQNKLIGNGSQEINTAQLIAYLF